MLLLRSFFLLLFRMQCVNETDAKSSFYDIRQYEEEIFHRISNITKRVCSFIAHFGVLMGQIAILYHYWMEL